MKTYITILLLLITTLATAQQQQQPAKDTSKQFAVILTENEISALFTLIKSADEKPSIITAWINLISTRARTLEPPKTEAPKK